MQTKEKTNMDTQKHDIKAQVAKLMATEDLDVQFANVETASFDPKNRTLTIPNYKDDLTKEEYDLFIGHEVGHALYTPLVRPDEVDTSRKGFGPFVNIVEDVRIEKAIQSKYPGLTRSFRSGYADLIKRGFFGDDIDYDKMNLGDKANMFFKAGFHHTGISFSEDEQKIVDAMANADSWDKVVKAAQSLYDYVGQQGEDMPDDPQGPGMPQDDDGESDDSDGESSGNGPGQDSEDNDETEDSDSGRGDIGGDDDADSKDDADSDDTADDDGDGVDTGAGDDGEEEKDDSAKGSGNGNEDAEKGEDDGDDSDTDGASKGYTPTLDGPTPELETQKAFDKKSRALLANDRYSDVTNAYIPEALDASMLPWQEVYTDLKNRTAKYSNDVPAVMARFHKLWREFKSENKAVVSYLAKEFEMRKSADEHQRTAMAKTGQLNTAILHTYKFNEDLFKKAAVVTAGKNHGLVMVVDWSGSMGNRIVDTISQIQIMAMFCRQVNIPFDVYAFNGHYTGVYKDGLVNEDGYELYEGDATLDPSFTSADGELALERQRDTKGRGQGCFKLINYLSSTMRNTQFESAMTYLMMVKDSFSSHYYYDGTTENPIARNGGWHRLGGTPLCEAIVATAKVVNDFRAKYRLQVVNTIFLTDGEGGYGQSVHGPDGGVYRGSIVMRDRKTKRYYRSPRSDGYAASFKNWLDWFYDTTGMRIINFYIYGSTKNDLQSAFRSFDIPEVHEVDTYDKMDKIISKEEHKALVKSGFYYRDDIAGYHSVFFIRAKNLKVAEDKMAGLDADATLAKKRNAFIKNQREKLGSRMFMDRVAEMIS
jgi:hypothetical protein